MASPSDGPVAYSVIEGRVTRVLKFFHSTAKRLLGAGCVGLSYLFGIALMGCVGGTPSTKSPASGSTDTPAIAFASVSGGGAHTCWLRIDDSVECWGSKEDGESNSRDGSFASVSAGVFHTCGLRSGGSVECWGANEHGQSNPPHGSFASVSAGALHTFAARTEVWRLRRMLGL